MLSNSFQKTCCLDLWISLSKRDCVVTNAPLAIVLLFTAQQEDVKMLSNPWNDVGWRSSVDSLAGSKPHPYSVHGHN